MSVNKYSRRKNGRSGDYDILGIVLIIISVFLLLCTIIPVMFGIVSQALRSVILGLFGVSAYVILTLMLAIGICLVTGRKVDVPASRIALVAGIAVFLLLLLQLVTTMGFIDMSFGDYLARAYEEKFTAGGLIFGIIAYALKAINIVFAYIVFSLGLVACAGALGYFIYKDYMKKERAALHSGADENAPQHRRSVSFTDDVPPQRVHMHTPTKLFVENIVPEKHADDMSDGENLGDSDTPADRNIDQTYAYKMLYDNMIRDKKVSEFDEQFIKSQAKDELYTKEQIYRPAPAAQVTQLADTEALNVNRSDVQYKKPDKIVHTGNMPKIVIPKQKEDDNYVNPNRIINTDEEFRGGIVNESTYADSQSVPPEKTFNFYRQDRENIIAGGESVSYGFSPPPVPEPKKDEPVNDSPIINADYFASINGVNERETAQKPEANGFYAEQETQPERKIPEVPQSPIISDKTFEEFSVLKEEKKPEDDKHVGYYSSFSDFPASAPKEPSHAEEQIKPAEQESAQGEEEKNDSPIINNAFEEFIKKRNQLAEEDTSEEELLSGDIVESGSPEEEEDTEVIPAPETEAVFSETKNETVSEPVYIPPVRTENADERKAPEPDRASEEVVDMSEKKTDFRDNNDGYYTVERKQEPAVKKPKDGKSKILEGQLDIDSAVNPESGLVDIPQAVAPYVYSAPPVSLLKETDGELSIDTNDIEAKSHDIEEVLASLKFPAKVVNVISGPTVTRYELQPQAGIPVRKILSLDKDLEFTLARGAVRIEAPVANKQAIGIEVANNAPAIVGFREIIESSAYCDSKSVLPLALGKDIGGDCIVRNLEKMPHLLIAGTTGTGKSVCLNTLILSLVYKCSPEEVRIILVDPKQVEFTLYHDLPHLLLRNPITNVEHAINALDWLIDEMNRRYDIFSNLANKGYPVRNLAEYNASSLVRERKAMKLPYIVMIVDELADLMSTRKKDVENRIRTITQKSRASGIHLVLATQRPSVDVITGTIKINLPTRIAFKVTSNADSRTILDQGGAETLLGRGDMLLMDNAEPIRLQGAFVSNDEIVSVVDYVKKNNEACFDENIANAILSSKEQAVEAAPAGDDEESADEKLFPDIMRCLIKQGTASTSLVQRRFSLGYSRASRIIDVFEQRRWVGPSAGAKPREVFMTETQFEEYFNRPFDE